MVGAGFIAETRARSYAAVTGYEVRIVAVVSRSRDHAVKYARAHGVPDVYENYEDVLARSDVDVVDLCVPNHLHRPMTKAAAAAGKHIICAKPLTAFGRGDVAPGTEFRTVPRGQMLRAAVESADAMVVAAERAGVRLMYAEN